MFEQLSFESNELLELGIFLTLKCGFFFESDDDHKLFEIIMNHFVDKLSCYPFDPKFYVLLEEFFESGGKSTRHENFKFTSSRNEKSMFHNIHKSMNKPIDKVDDMKTIPFLNECKYNNYTDEIIKK